MKNLVYILITMMLCAGCSHEKQPKTFNDKESIQDTNDYEYGDFKIDENGDTFFYVIDNKDIWVSAKEWHEFFEQYKEEIDSIMKGLK